MSIPTIHVIRADVIGVTADPFDDYAILDPLDWREVDHLRVAVPMWTTADIRRRIGMEVWVIAVDYGVPQVPLRALHIFEGDAENDAVAMSETLGEALQRIEAGGA